jgi:hypothetical protein
MIELLKAAKKSKKSPSDIFPERYHTDRKLRLRSKGRSAREWAENRRSGEILESGNTYFLVVDNVIKTILRRDIKRYPK